MSPLESAISQLQEEFDSYSPGTKDAPAPSTDRWYLLRAVSIGLTYLKQVAVRGLDNDPAAAEALYRVSGKELKAANSLNQELQGSDQEAAAPLIPQPPAPASSGTSLGLEGLGT